MTYKRCFLVLSLAVMALLAGLAPRVGAQTHTPLLSDVPAGEAVPPYALYVPPSARDSADPVPVLLALPGMGQDGPTFAARLAALADEHGWVLVSPTFAYGDWTSPPSVLREDVSVLAGLHALLQDVAAHTDGVPVAEQALVLGFSRGAQLAHRLVYFYPGDVLAVAALSAGTYTLPDLPELPPYRPLPFGTDDLARYAGHRLDLKAVRRVPFFVGVGGADNNPDDVPRAWDRYEGGTRVQRAEAFSGALQALGVGVEFVVFPEARHQLTDDMLSAAATFLADRSSGG